MHMLLCRRKKITPVQGMMYSRPQHAAYRMAWAGTWDCPACRSTVSNSLSSSEWDVRFSRFVHCVGH